jgi:uncharacterized protein YbjT (DUF2867 family)
MRVAVVGGTGVVGRHAVAVLRGRGHEVRVLSRSAGVDVRTGRGLPAALDGVGAVVDVANVATTRRAAATGFFTAVTEHLLDAGRRAGVGHHVVLSIVGIDDVDTGYYAGKRRQEALALAGGVPASVLRATQFHEFAAQMLDRLRLGPVAFVPRMRTQPVAAREVGEALADLAVGPAVGRAPDLGGPEVHTVADLVGRVLRARGERVRLVPFPVPGRAGRAMAGSGLLPGPDARRGRTTFEEWLTAPDGLRLYDR